RLLVEHIARDLQRRKLGYGRGGRMKIEPELPRILAGVRHGVTMGTPLAVFIENADHAKAWATRMAVEPADERGNEVSLPRPGHADLTGAIKFGHRDLRNSLERASARETAMRVALAATPAIKAVELGDGFRNAELFGSKVHDPMDRKGGGIVRPSNHAGGLEGGITNGEPLFVRAAMKPIATVPAALRSVDLRTGEADAAHVERSDTCAVPAAAVVGEAVVALCVADALLAKLGGDSMDELYAALRLAWRRARPLAGHVWLCGLPGAGKTTLAPLL